MLSRARKIAKTAFLSASFPILLKPETSTFTLSNVAAQHRCKPRFPSNRVRLLIFFHLASLFYSLRASRNDTAGAMSGISPKVLPLGVATYLIHHVFLPPKLPEGDDFDLSHEIALLDITIASLSAFKDCINIDRRAIVGSAIAMITSLKAVHLSAAHGEGAISEEKLKVALTDMCKNGELSHKHISKLNNANLHEGGTIPLHLRAQNCGVMISKSKSSIHVEAFELSPLNEAVISTKGRLRRTFPGCAIAVDHAIFEQPSFIAAATQTLAKMSHQSAVGTKPKARKAFQMHAEDRDTTHPNIVTELFMGFLKSVGQPVDVSCISKHTREEVMFKASM